MPTNNSVWLVKADGCELFLCRIVAQFIVALSLLVALKVENFLIKKLN
jgi:hypothetical protein